MDWKYKDLLNSHVLKWIFPVSIISTIFYLYSNKVEEELEDEDPRKVRKILFNFNFFFSIKKKTF